MENPTEKYTQRSLPEGINLDLFIANQDDWGLIFVVGTGSAEFSHNVLAKTWVKKGFKNIGGMLYKNGNPILVREEEDLFKILKIQYLIPANRA